MTWKPPPLPHPGAPGRVRGALYGSLLFDRPEHAATRDAVRDFLAAPGPVAVEVGFDHGMCILDHARRFPDVRWLGLEIRRRRVDAARRHAPDNCLLLRADARTALAALVPEGRLERVDVMFPTPTDNSRHLLFTPWFVDALGRALRPGGRVHLATDVPGMHAWVADLLSDWPDADPPPRGPVLSRRERVCRRDGLPVYRLTKARA